MASSPTDTDLQPVAVAERLAESPSPTPQDRWPWYYGLFAPAFRPATAARKLAYLSVFQTFLIHLLAAVLFMELIDIFAGLAEAAEDFGREGWTGFVSLGLGGMWSELWSEVVRYPEAAAIMAIAAVGFEIQIALFALLIGPWGARDERIRTSIRNAFRCVWLHSAHALVLLVVLGMVFCVLTAMAASWEAHVDLDELCPWPTTYPDPLSANSSPEQQAEHARLMKEFNEAWLSTWQMRQQLTPWYADERDEFLMVWGLFPGQWWMLWALLRAVGAPRVVPPLPRPPTCETCGYNLTGTPRDGRCSECGETVESSLGDGVRPGFGWRGGGWLPLAWLRCAYRAATAPAAIGREIQVVSRQTDHRLFLVPSLVIAFLLGTSTFFLGYFVSEVSLPISEVTVHMLIAPAMGYAAAGGMLGFVLLAAGVVGLWYGHGAQRNLCPASMQMAVYVSPVLLLWLLISEAMIVLVSAGMLDWVREFLAARRWLSVSVRQTWLDPDVWFGLVMVLLAVLSLLLYVRLIARGVAAARYANR